MQFRPDLIARIYAGSPDEIRERVAAELGIPEIPKLRGHMVAKTQTRRRGYKNQYQRDRVYTVQPGRGEPHVGHILITDVKQQRLGDITNPEALAEGFSSRGQFLSYWKFLYGEEPDLDEVVWVYTFSVVEQLALAGAPLAPSAHPNIDDGI